MKIHNNSYFERFDLIFEPFENIKSDAEGSIVDKKFVIKNGHLVEFFKGIVCSKENYRWENHVSCADTIIKL